MPSKKSKKTTKPRLRAKRPTTAAKRDRRPSGSAREVVQRYIDGVLGGKRLVGRLERLCVERHARDLRDGHRRGLWHDRSAAEHAIAFFRFLRHSKGEWCGQPFELSDWQQFIVWNLFGWKRADNTRRFREAHVEIARKNGKTTFAAGVALYLLAADGEPGAEIYAAATKIEQARIVHEEADRMVRRSPGLAQRITSYKDSLFIAGTASKFVPLATHPETQDGFNPQAAIEDECHAYADGELHEVLQTGMGARRQPLTLQISTAGADPTSFFGGCHAAAIDVLEGNVANDAGFYYIAAVDEDDDPLADPSCWPKANPNMGVSVYPAYLEAQAERALRLPSERNSILRKNFNRWTQQQTVWLPMEHWAQCAAPIDRAALVGRECVGALDLASTTDLAALVLLFRLEAQRVLVPFFWMPKDNLLERERQDHFQYTRLVREGFIAATPGSRIDYDRIRADLRSLGETYRIREVAFDPWNATQLVTQLMGDGFAMVQIRQGYASLSAPAKEFERLVVSHLLAHGGNEVLTWMAAGTAIEEDPTGNIKPSKTKSTRRIDGILAGVMATGRDMLGSERKSVYETRGVLEIG